MASREDSVLNSLISFFKDIPCPAYGMDKFLFKGTVDLVPEVADAGLNHVRVGVEAVVPDMLYDHGLGHDPSGISHEVFKQ